MELKRNGNKMYKITKLVTGFPKFTILIILLVTIFFGYNIKNIKVDPDITTSLPKNIPARKLYDKMNEIFPSKDFVLIAIETDSVFSLKFVRTVYDLTNTLETLPEVYSVMSPTNIKLIRGTEEGMEVKEILPTPPETERDIQKYKHDLFNSDLPIENIISKDQRMIGIMVFVKKNIKPEEAAKRILDYLDTLDSPYHIFASGKPVLTLYLARGMARDMRLLFPLVILLIIVILWLSFRSLRGVLIPLAVVLISVTWTIGLMALLGVPITHSTNMLPILLASIAVADGIHIVNRYYDLIRANETVKDAVLDTMKELNSPVILTSVTTAFGFLALNTSNIGSVGDLGQFTAFGVIAAMVFSLTFIPAALTLLKRPKKIKAKESGFLSKLAVKYSEFIITKRKYLLAFIALVIVLSIIGWPQIVLENNSINNFPEDHPARISYENINKHFAGTTFLSILVEGDSAGAIKDPSILRKMDSLENFLASLEHVGSTLSLSDFIKRMNKVLHADSEKYNAIPPDTVWETGTDWVEENGQWIEKPVKFKVAGKDLVAQYLQLYEMSGKPDDFSNLVDYNYQNARINAFINTESSNVLRDIDHKTRAYIQKHFPQAKIELTGTSELFLAINDLVVSGQFKSIFVSLILVIGVTSFAFRSLKIGLLNGIPLLFAMVFNFGYMGWFGIDLNIVTALTSSIAIGVGVDYAVHFIHRYIYRLSEFNEEESVRKTIFEAGIPIVINAVTVGLGFAIMMFSTFTGVKHMGLLITLAMFTSCFGAIAILPTYFLTYKPKFLKEKRSD